MLRLLLLLGLIALPLAVVAQEESPLVVMNLAAHPDDEDGLTLAYYRNAKDAVAYSVIFTRGEGGQNEIGPELYQTLGAIRTDETERAARHLGTDVRFLNFYDFGFSKHATESFEAWGGRDHVTARLVKLIRTLKPDVLFTNHDTVTVGPGRQHGHHQAVGLAAYDAMRLAADPTYHPEHLREPGVDLWQPQRLFLRHWSKPEAYDVAVPVGDIEPATGRPYGARAADALREHASQGMERWAARVGGIDSTYFSLLASATETPPSRTDLAAGLPPNTAATPDLRHRIDAGRLPRLPEGAVTVADSVVVPGQALQIRWTPEALPAPHLRWVFTGAVDTTLYLSATTPGLATLRAEPDATPTVPAPEWQYERFRSHPPIAYALFDPQTDALLAGGYLPVEVAPPLVLATPEPVVRLRGGAGRLPITARVYDPTATAVDLNLSISHTGTGRVLRSVHHRLPAGGPGPVLDTLTFTLPDDLAAGTYHLRLAGLATPGTGPPRPADLLVEGRAFGVEVPAGLSVGIVESYDDGLARALDELGVRYRRLDSLALARADFDGLHTIVVDIRGYATRPDLRAHNDRLLEWVAEGGHLVVNYQKTFEWNEDQADPFGSGATNPEGGFAPYPITLSRDRVTVEEAPVDVLVPDHVLFRAPNSIRPDDWDGWVQERGLYFPSDYDDAYLELVSLSDPGEAPLTGSTLLATYGQGTYLYTALVWYRQLKAFHPGAFRLFANLISLPLTDDRGTPVAPSPATGTER